MSGNEPAGGMDSSVTPEASAGHSEVEPVDATTPDHAGENVLQVVSSPPPSDDKRFETFLNQNQGTTPNGWDYCQSPSPVTRAPAGCGTCPPPSVGAKYLRYTGTVSLPDCGAGPGQVCPPQPDSQVYAYFTPPLTARAMQGLWFDLIRLAGDPLDATLTIYATDWTCGRSDRLGCGASTLLFRVSRDGKPRA